MKVSRAKEYLHLVQAMAEGKTIQSKGFEGRWVDWAKYEEIQLNDEPEEYRIKPEPKLRAWNDNEVQVGAVIKLKDSHYRHLILASTSDGVMVTHTIKRTHFVSVADLLEMYEHSTDGGKTWLPCGVMEAQP